MTTRIDKDAIFKIVNEARPSRVVFNCPDGLLAQTRAIAHELESSNQIQAIFIADPTYGSCDTVDVDAQRLGADIAFHVGHNVRVTKFGKITYSIGATDDIPFDDVAQKAVQKLKDLNYTSAGLVAYAQHLNELEKVSRILENNGISAKIGKGMGQLHNGQIFGCEFYPAYNIRNEVDAMALLGQSMFHAIGLCLSTGKPTFMLDPYENDVIDVQKTAEERVKKAVLSIYKAQEADSIGVIIGLKEGQMMPEQSINIKKKLESFGKKVQLVALREITSDRLNALTGIDAFVQTGCPRISVDGYTFSKPVLSVPQTDALISLLSGKEIGMDLFERKNWL